jgi:hypothetical protein
MILDEVAEYLQTSGVGTIGTNIFKSYGTNLPNTSLFIYETGGFRPQDTFGSTCQAAWENPTIQIVSRSTNYETARRTGENAYRALINVVNETLKSSSSDVGSFYLRIFANQAPFRLGVDENDRHQIACNFGVMKTFST